MAQQTTEIQIDIPSIIKDERFIQLVKEGISELRRQRSNRQEPKQGYRYKRDWYDRMTENKIFNAQYFIDNISDIWQKRSSLSADTRNVISFVCNSALMTYLKTNQKTHEKA